MTTTDVRPATHDPRAAWVQDRPAALTRATWLMWVLAALSLFVMVTTLLTVDEIVTAASERASDPALQDADGWASPRGVSRATAIAFIVFTGLLGLLFWGWLARTAAGGHRWARWLATAAAAVVIWSGVVGLTKGNAIGLASQAATAATMVVALAMTALLWLPQNEPYIDARS